MNHKLLFSLHIMDEPKFEIHKIHNRRRSREQFKIQNSKFKIQKGVLLHSKTSPFATQKESFYTPKRVLLKAKRSPFEKFPHIFRENHTALYGFYLVSQSGKHYLCSINNKTVITLKLFGL